MNALVTVQPYAVSDLERMAKAFASSKLFGVQNPEQALALCLVAQAEGRHPATAAQDYSIIQGRPSKKADAMLRDFLASGGRVEWHQLDNAKADATFSHPAGGKVRIDWTLDRAKAAGLANNAMYSKYPRQMLRARTVSEGVRTVCPGATSGMYVPEEVQDFEEARDVTPPRARIAQAPPEPEPQDAPDDGGTIFAAVQAAKVSIEMCTDVAALKKWRKDNEAQLAKFDTDAADEIVRAFNARYAELKAAKPAANTRQPEPASADNFGLGDDDIPPF